MTYRKGNKSWLYFLLPPVSPYPVKNFGSCLCTALHQGLPRASLRVTCYFKISTHVSPFASYTYRNHTYASQEDRWRSYPRVFYISTTGRWFEGEWADAFSMRFRHSLFSAIPTLEIHFSAPRLGKLIFHALTHIHIEKVATAVASCR